MDLANLNIDLGEGVMMRLVRESDVDAVFDVVRRNYDHLLTFMEWAKPDYSRKDAEEWVANGTDEPTEGRPLNFAIFRGKRMIGTIGFAYFDLDVKVTEIGYWIDCAEQGKGIMSSATAKLVDLAFDRLGMNRIQIRCASENRRSAAIPERRGFKKEGVQRQHVIRNGVIYDFCIYGLLRAEWLSQRTARLAKTEE